MVTLSKLECSKQAFAVNTLAWNNTIGLWLILLVCKTGVMIKRDSRFAADPGGRHYQVGSLAGAAHLLKSNAGVLR